jgi:hypothetical protein
MESRFKKDFNLQIHLHKTFFPDDQLSDLVHKSFLYQTTLNLRKKKWGLLNRDMHNFSFNYKYKINYESSFDYRTMMFIALKIDLHM